jgi:ubiquinone biosynthesis protein
MKHLNILYRLIFIQYVFVKNGLDELLTRNPRLWCFRFVVYLNPFFWVQKKEPRGVAIRRTLETLGPIFVKFGQALSTRPDLIPADIIVELSKLQDRVPPFSSDKVQKILEKNYKQALQTIFAEFDLAPLASASIAQVHAATLHTGQKVVVKILRPQIKKIIKEDLFILFTLARWIEKYLPHGQRLKPVEIVQEFKHTILDELDFNREAANAVQLKRNFANSPLLYVPEVYWDYVKEHILVIERIDAIPVNDISQLEQYGIDRKKLAERGIEIFFTQVFRDCFFHADMHPGNIFVSREYPKEPQYICIDFGIIGTLNQTDQYYLAENLLAFFNRDYLKVANLHIASGWVPKHTRPEAFASAIRTVCEPIFEKPLKDISFGLLITRLIQVARRFHMIVQPQLILLQKTLLAVEGLGRQIYPELDLWQTAKPFLEKWVKQQMGPKAFLKHCKENIPFIMKDLPYMPRLINEVLCLTKQHYQNLHTVHDAHNKENSVKSNRWRFVEVLILGIGAALAIWAYPRFSYIASKQEMMWFFSGIGVASILTMFRKNTD